MWKLAKRGEIKKKKEPEGTFCTFIRCFVAATTLPAGKTRINNVDDLEKKKNK